MLACVSSTLPMVALCGVSRRWTVRVRALGQGTDDLVGEFGRQRGGTEYASWRYGSEECG
jgi:hypothetical protein